MFTDEKLKQLHLDAEYRKSNRLLTNLKHSVHIVKNGNGYFSLTMSTSSSVSLSINLIKIFWFILKYIFITKELVDFRKNVLEYVLHEYFDIKFNFIKNSVKDNNKWLEYNDEKLFVVKNLCLAYLSNVDNRLIFIKYSTKNKEASERKLMNTIVFLDMIFERTIENIKMKRLLKLSYEFILGQNDNEDLKKIIISSMEKGNLTSKGGEA